MVLTPSTMLPLGTAAPNFELPDTNGKTVSRSEFEGSSLLVMFICNHCPYVKHVRSELAQLGKDYKGKGIEIVAINANDVANYPDDHPERMKEEVTRAGYVFPYLFDESQEVAKSYTAACTPDFFLFDNQHKLVYRGQLDGSRPDNEVPLSGKDLRHAIDQVLKGQPISGDQTPSVGCNIKWRAGNAPGYSSS